MCEAWWGGNWGVGCVTFSGSNWGGCSIVFFGNSIVFLVGFSLLGFAGMSIKWFGKMMDYEPPAFWNSSFWFTFLVKI